MKNRHVHARQTSLARALVSSGLLAFGTLMGTGAQAALTFNFDFQGEFVGNASAQQAVITAGNLFSDMFATHFTNTATVDFTVFSQNVGLASAGTYALGVPGFGNGEAVRNKIINGVDLTGPGAEGFININLAVPFQLDPTAPVDFANGQIDFYSVMDHELTHALGFVSLGYTTGGAALSKFDQFLTTNGGTALFDPVTGITNAAALDDALANSALFNGANTVAQYGAAVPIQGPDGDLSHLGTDAFTIPTTTVNGLMLCCGNPNSPDQSEPRNYNLAEIGIMTDLGYTPTAAVPEPSTYALMLAGLAVAGFAAKRRKS
jgi:hypothetical protein